MYVVGQRGDMVGSTHCYYLITEEERGVIWLLAGFSMYEAKASQGWSCLVVLHVGDPSTTTVLSSSTTVLEHEAEWKPYDTLLGTLLNVCAMTVRRGMVAGCFSDQTETRRSEVWG